MNFAKSLTDTAALIDAVRHIRLNVVKFFHLLADDDNDLYEMKEQRCHRHFHHH